MVYNILVKQIKAQCLRENEMKIKELFAQQNTNIQNVFKRQNNEYLTFIDKIQQYEKISNNYIALLDNLIKSFPESRDDK